MLIFGCRNRKHDYIYQEVGRNPYNPCPQMPFCLSKRWITCGCCRRLTWPVRRFAGDRGLGSRRDAWDAAPRVQPR